MRAFVRRAAIPVIAFLVATGLQVGGFEDRGVAYSLFMLSALVGLIAFITWPPMASRMHFPWTIVVQRRRPMPETKPPAALVQFTNSAFTPAWTAAIQLMVETREAIRRNEGERIEGMFQQIMERNGAAWRRLDGCVRQQECGGSLDELLADAYVEYELMVRWIQQGGAPHGSPQSHGVQLEEWRRADARMVDKLGDVVGHPDFQMSQLAKKFKQEADSGIPKIMRERLLPKADTAAVKPLESSLDVDGNWRRLRVFNPNPFTAKRCCVQIIDYEAPGGRPDVTFPSKGFKFGWSTTNVDQPSRYIDIGPSAEAFADLHQLIPEQGLFTHVSPGNEPDRYRPLWPLPAGAYTYVVNVVSEGEQGVPSHLRTINVVYDGQSELILEFAPSEA